MQDVLSSSSAPADGAFGSPEASGGGGAIMGVGVETPSPPILQTLKVVELRHLLKQHKLKTTGRKADLIARLNKHCAIGEICADDDS